MRTQYELAFRTLQGGLNMGKIVLRITPCTVGPLDDGDSRDARATGRRHLVTGGTSGLGLLTGRWLAQRGAQCVTLASRSGALMMQDPDTAAEWQAMVESGATNCIVQCNTGRRHT